MNQPIPISLRLRPQPDVRYRHATLQDLPALSALLESAGLPARHIEPFIDTFLVAEVDDAIIGCGGIEVRGDTAVLRSVAVEEAYRGTGVGKGLSIRLVGLAISRRVTDVYLFTADAWAFWEKLGFITISLADWRRPARESWQYKYVSAHQKWADSIGLRTMWLPVAT